MKLVGFSVLRRSPSSPRTASAGARPGSASGQRYVCRVSPRAHRPQVRALRGVLGKSRRAALSETAMAARSATPDFGDDGVDEVDGRFPEPVAEPRTDADDPPALTSGFFGRRKVVPPIGEAKTPTSTKSRTSQAEEKLEEMLESGKHFLEGLGTGRHGVKRQDTLDKNYWLSLEDEASKSKQFGSHPDLILKQKNRKKCRLRSIEQCEFPKSLKDKNLWVLNPQNRYSWDLTILVLIILVMVLAPFEIAFVRASVGFNRNACNTNHAGPGVPQGFFTS